MKTVAGIDLGTQSMKVVIYDYEKKEIIEKASCPMDLISESDGTREQKTEWFDKGLEVCFGKLSAENKKTIEAIGVSGQQHGFVPLDKDGKALYNIKLWCDTSTVAECDQITKAAGGDKAVIDALGNLMLTGFTAPKILWLKNHKADAFAALKYIMLPHDYLNWKPVRLCGINSRFQLLSPCVRQVTHALLTRPPLSIPNDSSEASFLGLGRNTPFDLHVLSTPPAFILSQDQTLK